MGKCFPWLEYDANCDGAFCKLCKAYGRSLKTISTLLAHYGVQKAAETMLGEPTIRETVITSNVTTEWKTYHQVIVNKSESNMKLQLKELAPNDTLKPMFPNLSKLTTIDLSNSAATASVERSRTKMKLIKTRL